MLGVVFNGNKDNVLCDYSLRTLEKSEHLIKVAIELFAKKISVNKLLRKQIYLKDMINIFSDKNISSSVKVQIINN